MNKTNTQLLPTEEGVPHEDALSIFLPPQDSAPRAVESPNPTPTVDTRTASELSIAPPRSHLVHIRFPAVQISDQLLDEPEWSEADDSFVEICLKTIVNLGGGKYIGIQKGDSTLHLRSFVLFTDSFNSTIAVSVDTLRLEGAEAVRRRIRENKEFFEGNENGAA